MDFTMWIRCVGTLNHLCDYTMTICYHTGENRLRGVFYCEVLRYGTLRYERDINYFYVRLKLRRMLNVTKWSYYTGTWLRSANAS